MASPLYLSSCCLGNQSAIFNRDIIPSKSLFEEKVVSIISLIFAILSLCGITVLLYPQRNVKTVAIATHNRLFQGQGLYHVTKCLILAGILADIGVIIRSIIWIQGSFPPPFHTTYGDANHIFCIIVSGLTSYFYLSTVIWHFVYAVEAHKVSNGKTSFWLLQHILGWFVPAVLCAVGLFIAYRPNLKECNVKYPKYRTILYVLLLSPIILVLLAVVVLLYKSVLAVKRSLIVHFGRYSTSERELINNIQVKFISITIAFSVCWIPNILNGIFVNAMEDRSGDITLVFLVLQAVLNPFQVLMDAMVLYGWPPALWKKVMTTKSRTRSGTINSNERSRPRSVLGSRSWPSERDPLISFSRTPNL